MTRGLGSKVASVAGNKLRVKGQKVPRSHERFVTRGLREKAVAPLVEPLAASLSGNNDLAAAPLVRVFIYKSMNLYLLIYLIAADEAS